MAPLPFLWLESSSSPRPVKHQRHMSPERLGGGRRGGWLRDGNHAAELCVCAEIESQFVPISMRLRGVRQVDEWLCVGVQLKESSGVLLSFYCSRVKRKGQGISGERPPDRVSFSQHQQNISKHHKFTTVDIWRNFAYGSTNT